jgi:RimJ/RimL family protein N-acetyltransferase
MEIPAGDWLIRSWREEDAPALSSYFSNPNVLGNLAVRNRYPYTEDHAKAWIDLCGMEAEPVNFAIAGSAIADIQGVVGGIGLTLQRGTRRQAAELGYWVGEPLWDRGIATAAVKAFVDYAFSQFDLLRIYAGVFDGNGASVRVLEKAGFAYEGTLRKSIVKDGRVVDELLYALVREG